MRWLVVVDFDGTITERDTQDGLLEKYAPEAYVEAERGLSEGRLTLRECMEQEFAAVGGDHDASAGSCRIRVRRPQHELVREVHATHADDQHEPAHAR